MPIFHPMEFQITVIAIQIVQDCCCHRITVLSFDVQTKYTTEYTGTAILPHKFDTGKPRRKILAVSGSEEDLAIARKYNADLSGGKQILSQVSAKITNRPRAAIELSIQKI